MDQQLSALNWRFAQSFGDKSPLNEITDGNTRFLSLSRLFLLLFPAVQTYHILADTISTIQFSSTGDFIATGDKGGRVVILQRDHSVVLHPFNFYILFFFLCNAFFIF